MSYDKTDSPLVETQTLDPPRPETCAPAALCQCLVVSADAARRALLAQAAADTGWNPVICADPDTAWAESRQRLIQLALVDLELPSGGQAPGFRRLVERLSSDSETLLAVCGPQDDAAQEVWARRLGAWLYLPSIAADSDVALICAEARHVAERLAQNRAPRAAIPRRRSHRRRTSASMDAREDGDRFS